MFQKIHTLKHYYEEIPYLSQPDEEEMFEQFEFFGNTNQKTQQKPFMSKSQFQNSEPNFDEPLNYLNLKGEESTKQKGIPTKLHVEVIFKKKYIMQGNGISADNSILSLPTITE